MSTETQSLKTAGSANGEVASQTARREALAPAATGEASSPNVGNSQSARPKVSVCIPTFNRGAWLASTMESILRQTYTDFELIVVDNCSDDDTASVVASFSDPRIRHARSPVRLPKIANINRCVTEARCELIAIYHDDDTYHPDLLRRSVEIMERHPRAGVVCSAVHVVDPTDPGRQVATYIQRWSEVVPGREMRRRLTVRWDCPVNASTAMVRRKVYDDVGLWRPEYGEPADREFWLRAFAKWDFGYIAEPLAWLRGWGEHRGVNPELIWETLRNHVKMQRKSIDMVFGGSPLRVRLERLRLAMQRQRKFWNMAFWSLANGHSDVTAAGIRTFREEGMRGSAAALGAIHRSARATSLFRIVAKLVNR